MISGQRSDMAIYFSDTAYLECFLRYISDKNIGVSCCGFTRDDKLKSYAVDHRISLLLTDETCFNNELRQISTELTIVLTETPIKGNEPDVYYIDILQPLDVILRAILKKISDSDIPVNPGIVTDTGSVYCFYSPVGRCLKTTLSMAAAQILSDKAPSLYLNLEAVSGFPVLFGESYDADISDLFFFLRDESREKYAVRLGSMVRTTRGAHYVPPAMNPGDIAQINTEDIRRMLEAASDTGFKNVIIDAGVWLPSFEEILEACDRIFVPVRRDSVSEAKLSQIISYLKYTGRTGLSERMQAICPPDTREMYDITSDLRSTEIGKYTAELLR